MIPSSVRLHTDGEADLLAKQLQATAFTSGKDIYFQSGEFDPVNKLELLAHEAAHVKQQDSGKVGPGVDPDAGLESEAQAFGTTVAENAMAKTAALPATGRSGNADAPTSSVVQRKSVAALVAAKPASAQPVAAPTLAEAALLLRKISFLTAGTRAPLLAELDATLKRSANDSTFWQQVATLGSEKYGKNFVSQALVLLPNPAQSTLRLALLGDEQGLTYAAFVNQLAFTSYSNAPDLSDVKAMPAGATNSTRGGAQAILKAAGYRALPTVQGLWGFQMRVFHPIPGQAKYPKTIVAFRGTEGIKFAPWEFKPVGGGASAQKTNESGLDTLTDLAAYATAYSQYEANQKAIIDPLLKSLGSNLVATGHSLGGGLAQIAVAKHAAQFSEVYTYQSANIKKEDVDRLAKLSPTLKAQQYRVKGDAVPTSGEAAIRGQVFESDRVTGFKGSPMDNLDAAGGHNAPIALELLQEFRASGQLSQNNALSGALLKYGSQDVRGLKGGQTTMNLVNSYSTRVDTTPGKEGAKQVVTGNLHLPQMVNTYKNNAIYNVSD